MCLRNWSFHPFQCNKREVKRSVVKKNTHVLNNIHVQPVIYAIDGGLHVVEVFPQAVDGALQLLDLLRVACTKQRQEKEELKSKCKILLIHYICCLQNAKCILKAMTLEKL